MNLNGKMVDSGILNFQTQENISIHAKVMEKSVYGMLKTAKNLKKISMLDSLKSLKQIYPKMKNS